MTVKIVTNLHSNKLSSTIVISIRPTTTKGICSRKKVECTFEKNLTPPTFVNTYQYVPFIGISSPITLQQYLQLKKLKHRTWNVLPKLTWLHQIPNLVHLPCSQDLKHSWMSLLMIFSPIALHLPCCLQLQFPKVLTSCLCARASKWWSSALSMLFSAL